MNTKKIISYTVLSGFFSLLLTYPGISQDQNKDYSAIEEIQDEIENLYIKTYSIYDQYPHLTYEYIFDDGEVTSVKIAGIPSVKDKKRLEVYMMDIADLEEEIFNQTNRTGIYYVTETDPKPADGFDEFYSNLRAMIDYPSIDTYFNHEGTIFAKFVVDAEGEIDNVILTSNFSDKDNVVVKEMKHETREAILATSGDWKPATVGDIPVPQWMVLPVRFDQKENSIYPIR